jgi:uncharacterized protein (TIGR02597 family)
MLSSNVIHHSRSLRLCRCTLRLTLAGFALLACCSPRAQVATSASGFYTLQIHGTHGSSTAALSFVGFGLTRPPVCQGRLDSFGPNTVTDSRAKWVDGQFEGLNGPHYLEIASGPYAGFTTDIITSRGPSRSLVLDVDLSTLLSGGEAYTVRPHWTLASVFGPANEVGLGGGSCVTGDEILVLNTSTKAYLTYYYKTLGLGGTGWRSATSPFTDQSNAPLPLGTGVLIRRKQAGDVFLKLFGSVKTGNTLLQVEPGLNIVANIAPTGVMLGDSGLYTGDLSTGLAGGSMTSADQVLLFDGTSYQTYYYKTTGLGGTGWRSAASSSLDASSTLIPHGGALLIQRSASRPPFFWNVASPE